MAPKAPTYFGRALCTFREDAGLSQRALARLAHVPRLSIQKVESGETSYLSFLAAARCAQALGVSLAMFVDLDDIEETGVPTSDEETD